MKRINSEAKRALRRWLRDKYKDRCAYCSVQVGKAGTVDHYLPQSLGGTNARDNLRWSCKPCNNQKSDMTPFEWEERAPIPRRHQESSYEVRIRLLSQLSQRNVDRPE